MTTKLWQNINFTTIACIGLMALTRFHHFGSEFSLPDASLAVFFLAGTGVFGYWFFALLVLEAGFIDYLAITQFNVSDFCISPAYVCLIPTYAVLWFAGRYCKSFSSLSIVDCLKNVGLAAIATSCAFLLSNGSFYVLSGRFGQLSWDRFLIQASQYYPPYLSSTMIYIAVGLVIVKLWKSMPNLSIVES